MSAVRLPLEVRSGEEPGTLLVRVSNDIRPDAYGTKITNEALVDWVYGYLQHRAVNLEHDQGTLIGYAVGVDFTPNLVITVRLNEEGRRIVEAGEVVGGSIEFLPLESYQEADGTVVYTAVSGEPELTGLALTSRPAVPGAYIIERAAPLPLWAYAVVDPIVWERALPPEEAVKYAYAPHHDPKTRFVDQKALDYWISVLVSDALEVAEGGLLTREEVVARAKAHLERHVMGLLLPGSARRSINGVQYSLGVGRKGLGQGGEAMAEMENRNITPSGEPELEVDLGGVEELAAQEAKPAERSEPKKEAQAAPQHQRNTPAGSWPTVEVAPRQNPISAALYIALRAAVSGGATPEDRASLERALASAGVSRRAIELTGPNSVLINIEVVREVFRKPYPGAVLRNHYTVEPVAGTLVMRGVGYAGGVVAAFDTDPDQPSTAAHESIEQTLRPLRVFTEITQEFLTFNLLGPSWVDEVFLPEVMRVVSEREDLAFFVGTPNQAGLLTTPRALVYGVSSADYASTPKTSLLSRLVASLPGNYKGNRANLAIYAATDLVEEAVNEIVSRQTALGDASLVEGTGALAGPEPALRVRGVPVFYAPQIDFSPNQKAVLVYRPGVRVGQGMSLQVRSFPVPGFRDRIEFLEYIGWLFRYPDAIVRLELV